MADDIQALAFDLEEEAEPKRLAPASQQVDRSLARELKREAKYYAALIPDVLAAVGYDHWLRKESRPTGFEKMFFGESSRQKVQIMQVAYNEAAIYLRIDPLRLPYRVTVPMLRDPEMLETLSVACGRRVAFVLKDYAFGCWLVIDRAGAMGQIPKLFKFKDAINNIPKTAGPLRYCAGVTENMRLIVPNIENMPHMLVAGSTRSGKSVHLHAIICQLMWRNKPEDLKFLMIDLKGGMELLDYADSSFLWRPIVKEIEDVVTALRDYKSEMIKRQALFAGKARSLPEFNRYHADNKLPFIILVIDELAMVLRHPNRSMSQDAMLELGAILSVSRATGGHCIVCTQHPSTEVINGYVKANIDTRVAFKTASQSDSRVILDTSQAADIEIQGRAWLLDGSNKVQIQCPWISPTLIRRTMKAINERDQVEHPGDTVDIITLAEYALDHHSNRLSVRDLYADFKDKLSEYAIRDMLSAVDGEVLELRGNHYMVNPGNGGSKGRHLEQIDF